MKHFNVISYYKYEIGKNLYLYSQLKIVIEQNFTIFKQ